MPTAHTDATLSESGPPPPSSRECAPPSLRCEGGGGCANARSPRGRGEGGTPLVPAPPPCKLATAHNTTFPHPYNRHHATLTSCPTSAVPPAPPGRLPALALAGQRSFATERGTLPARHLSSSRRSPAATPLRLLPFDRSGPSPARPESRRPGSPPAPHPSADPDEHSHRRPQPHEHVPDHPHPGRDPLIRT